MSESFERGLQTRKEVLGAEYVENSIKNSESDEGEKILVVFHFLQIWDHNYL